MSLANELVEAVSAWPEVEAITLGGSRATGDNDEKSDPVTPEMDVVYAFNGRAISVQQLPAYGITACGVAPSDNNVFGGQAAAFITDGINGYRMCLRRGVATCAKRRSMTPKKRASSRMKSWRRSAWRLTAKCR